MILEDEIAIAKYRTAESFEHDLREMVIELSGENPRPDFSLRRAQRLLRKIESLKNAAMVDFHSNTL